MREQVGVNNSANSITAQNSIRCVAIELSTNLERCVMLGLAIYGRVAARTVIDNSSNKRNKRRVGKLLLLWETMSMQEVNTHV